MAFTGIVRAILKGRLGGTVQTRTMFVLDIAPGTGETENELLTDYLDSIFDPIVPLFTPVWALETVEKQHWIDTEWITMEEFPYTKTFTGTGESLAYQMAVVFIAKAIGKRLVGRKFLPGLSEVIASVNVIVATHLSYIAQAVAAYVTTVVTQNGGTVAPGIMDKNHAFHQFSGGYASTLLGTMRRRKPGVGI